MVDDETDPLNSLGAGTNPLTRRAYSDGFRETASKWSQLPLYTDATILNDVRRAIERSSLTVIVAGTSSGKTVIVPRLALYDPRIFWSDATVVVTNPKSSITERNASYAAQCADVELGREVGYAFRGAPATSRSSATRLLFATDGYVAAQVRSGDAADAFRNYACIIIDEAHERTVPIDHLFAAIKRRLTGPAGASSRLRVVVMSATMDPTEFVDYFGIPDRTTVVSVPGAASRFPVRQVFLKDPVAKEDYVGAALDVACQEDVGDALVFVPTSRDAERGCKLATADDPCGGGVGGAQRRIAVVAAAEEDVAVEGGKKKKTRAAAGEGFECATLYSRLPKAMRDAAADPTEPGQPQKLVFATNIAESSLTISTLDTVIDSGLELTKTFLPRRHSFVIEQHHATRSQITQRQGRVGRTSPGTCYHLYTEALYRSLPLYPTPAIRRNDLIDEIVDMMGVWRPPAWADRGGEQRRRRRTFDEVRADFDEYMTPPTEDQMDGARHLLDHYDALIRTAADVERPPRISFWNSLLLLAGAAHDATHEAAKLVAVLEECEGSPHMSLFYSSDYFTSDSMAGGKFFGSFSSSLSKTSQDDAKRMCATHAGIVALFDRIVVQRAKVKNAMGGAWAKIEQRWIDVERWYADQFPLTNANANAKNTLLAMTTPPTNPLKLARAVVAARSYHAARRTGGQTFRTLRTMDAFAGTVAHSPAPNEIVYEFATASQRGVTFEVVTSST